MYPVGELGGYSFYVEGIAMSQLIHRTAVTRTAASQDADTRIARLYEAEIGRLTALGHLLTGDSSAAEDLAQDVFVDLLEALRADADYLQGPPWPWLRKAMVHHAAKRFRLGTRELGRLMRFYKEQPMDETWSATTIDFQRAVAQLPARMRAVVVLRYAEDMTREQIADVLGCGLETVKTQLRRARPRVADLMGLAYHEGDDEEEGR